MNKTSQITSSDYKIRVEPLSGIVQASNGEALIASSSNAKVMYETRLSPTVYFPKSDLVVDVLDMSDLNTFCPFKGTASYKNMSVVI